MADHRNYRELYDAGELTAAGKNALLTSIESQRVFLFRAQFNRQLECPMRGHTFSILDALGGDPATLDRPYEPSPVYTCPTCGAKVTWCLGLIGGECWFVLAEGQTLNAEVDDDSLEAKRIDAQEARDLCDH